MQTVLKFAIAAFAVIAISQAHKCVHDEEQSKQKISKTNLNYPSDQTLKEGRRVESHTKHPPYGAESPKQKQKQNKN